MLGYFPTLYPDELLYSWFARYHKHSNNCSPKQTMKELFGSTKIVATFDIPSNLKSVYDNLSHFNIPIVKELSKNHTLFNYYTYFQSQSHLRKVSNYISDGGKPGSAHLLLGINTFTIQCWDYFRYCPTCCKDDTKKYGEPYWHLSHQLPKTFYCNIHEALLIDSKVNIRSIEKHLFYPAIDYVSRCSAEIVFYNAKTEIHLKNLSRENSILINKKYIKLNEKIEKIYKYLLQIHGYANVSGKVEQSKLALQFIKYYGEEFLDLVDSTVQLENESCWLKAITRKHRKAFHPIRHILLLNFFGVSVSDIENLIGKEFLPFGAAPYYCLNPASLHYKEKVIRNATISLCTDTRCPVGTFKCECGFVYSRRGPDKDLEDRWRIGRIKEFGDVWLEKLEELFYKDGLNYSQVAKRLKCDTGTVKKYLKRTNDIVKKSSTKLSNLKQNKENEFLDLIKYNPLLSMTELRRLNPALYTWHYRHNIQWLRYLSPAKQKSNKISLKVDWEKRDFETLQQIKSIVISMILEEKPVFINKSQISKRLKEPSYIEKHLDKLPKTKDYLLEHIETRLEFQIRRLYWSYEYLKVNNEEITSWKIRRIAGFKKEMDISIESILNRIDTEGSNV